MRASLWIPCLIGLFSPLLLGTEVVAFGADEPPAASPSTTATATATLARDLHVDSAQGKDSNDGVKQPFKTIKQAIRVALPGDTIHLAPATYYESAVFANKHGESSRPITLDGHGAVLEGSDPVTSKEWELVSPGLYRKQHLIPHIDDAVLQRWFMLWNGRMNHMGRSSKGVRPPFKALADLQPDEWTYVKEEDAFYVRIQPGQDLDAANIRYPFRSAGVALGGSCSDITVRNITGTHVYNDGYNIHGKTRNCRFENIVSIECGDDEFSAHDDCQCEIDGFLSGGNSTGFADVGESVTHYRNVRIQDCLGVDLLVMGDGEHSLTNAVVISSAHTPMSFDSATGNGAQDCVFTLKNVLFQRVAPAGDLRSSKGTALTVDHCTFLGASFVNTGGAITANSCVFACGPKSSITLRTTSRWNGARNLFDLQTLKLDQATFTAATFADFQKQNTSDADSKWAELPFAEGRFVNPLPQGIGADETELTKLGLMRSYLGHPESK